MKFEKEYFIGIKDIGKENQVTNAGFLSFLEEIASNHSATVGYGVNDIQTKNKVWLLMDWKLQVFERPQYGEALKIKTWARPIEKHFFYTYRDFEVFKGEKRVAIATSKWVFFDLQTNKIAKITDEILNLYHPEKEQVFEEKEIAKIAEPTEKSESIPYEVKRADIDINNHMHNLNYLKVAYEALPEEIYFREEKNNVRIMYKHQILLGDKINCYYTGKENKDIITIKSNDNRVLHAIVELS